jgi:hypothetical protein
MMAAWLGADLPLLDLPAPWTLDGGMRFSGESHLVSGVLEPLPAMLTVG